MNKQEFTRSILDLEKSLYYTAKAILKNDCDCADAVQNAIFSAYKKLHTLKNSQYFKTWITRILINECYGIIRQRKFVETIDAVPENDLAYSTTERSELYEEINTLEEKYRVTFVLYYGEGFSAKEIGSILKISESAVKTRLHRARKLLQEKLKGEYGYENN